jgi:hypothetical protein
MGMQCTEISNCVRSEPEFVGNKNLSPGYQAIAALMGLCVIVGISCFYIFCSAFLSVAEEETALLDLPGGRVDYVEMSAYRPSTMADVEGGGRGNSVKESYIIDAANAPPPVPFDDFSTTAGGRRKSSGGVKGAMRKISEGTSNMIRRKGRALCCCQAITVSSVLTVVILVAVACVGSVGVPVMYICNKEFDYASIMNSVTNFKLMGNIDILTSVYNPNRFGITLYNATVTFGYKGSRVGGWTLQEVFPVNGGYVNDLIVSASFVPSVKDAWAMSDDYEKGKLIIEVSTQLEVTFSAMGVESFLFPVEQSQEMDIFAFSDREHCKCVDGSS